MNKCDIRSFFPKGDTVTLQRFSAIAKTNQVIRWFVSHHTGSLVVELVDLLMHCRLLGRKAPAHGARLRRLPFYLGSRRV